MIRRFLSLVAATSTAVATAHAQIFAAQPSGRGYQGTLSVDVSGLVAQPTGGFRSNADRAFGVGTAVRYHFRRFDLLGLRGDFAYLNYGNETKRVPLSATINRVTVDMTTSNNIAVFSGGPELRVQRGPIRPYVYGFAGYSYFYTESSVGDDNEGAFASSTNFGDGGLATGWGGGLSIPLRLRSTSVAIDIGARRTINGPRSYLRRGDIQDQPDGSLQFNTRNTDADFLQYHVGASFSFRNR